MENLILIAIGTLLFLIIFSFLIYRIIEGVRLKKLLTRDLSQKYWSIFSGVLDDLINLKCNANFLGNKAVFIADNLSSRINDLTFAPFLSYLPEYFMKVSATTQENRRQALTLILELLLTPYPDLIANAYINLIRKKEKARQEEKTQELEDLCRFQLFLLRIIRRRKILNECIVVFDALANELGKNQPTMWFNRERKNMIDYCGRHQ